VDLAEFHKLVSDSLRRGTTQDSYIPGQVKLAALWLERNYTFRYMEQFRLVQLVTGDRTITLPTNKVVKSIKFLRLINSDNTYQVLKQVDPRDLHALAEGGPTSFWKVGSHTLVLNATPTEDLAGEAVLVEYTDWPVEPQSKHELMDMAADVLLEQSMLFMAAFLRDPAMAAVHKTLRDEALNTLTRAEDEGVYGGESVSMAYIPR